MWIKTEGKFGVPEYINFSNVTSVKALRDADENLVLRIYYVSRQESTWIIGEEALRLQKFLDKAFAKNEND